MKICVCPGSFDPVTNGHVDIIDRASKLWGKVIVAVLVNNNKKSIFTIDERVEFLKRVFKDRPNIEVDCFSGLLIDYTKGNNASAIVKGLRAVSDYEYELQMALLNKNIEPEIETLFMMANIKYSFLSSSIVRELAQNGGKIDGLIPNCILEDVIKKFDM